jgi:hypothetical protein
LKKITKFNNPTVAQIKNHKERKTRKSKAKACLFAAVSTTIFTRLMSLKSTKNVWDYLKKEYAGDDRIRGMQSLNLIREFEPQRMKDSETIKEYSDKLLGIVNKVRLLGINFSDCRIVEKILVTVPERYKASITTLENTNDLSKITGRTDKCLAGSRATETYEARLCYRRSFTIKVSRF